MQKAILGKKVGMTQVFDERGNAIPVTVLQAGPCNIIQIKNKEKDGYTAMQLGYGEQREKRANKPRKGHFKKANVSPKKFVKEVPLWEEGTLEAGQEIKADIFSEGEYVDVTGVSKGKGFAGSIKRHGFSRGPMSHGSHYHRGPGSLGSIDAARVFKGRPLPGRMGGERVTVQNLQVIKVYPEKDLILVKGAVPGPRGVFVMVRSAIKKAVEAKA